MGGGGCRKCFQGGSQDAIASGGHQDYTRAAVANSQEAEVIAGSVAINALCTANDANKKAAARLRGDFNEVASAIDLQYLRESQTCTNQIVVPILCRLCPPFP